MKLFDVPKIGLHLDAVTHGTEVRDGEEVKIATLSLRASPLTAQIASSMPAPIRMLLFRSTEGATPRANLRRVEFDLALARQRLDVFAAPDAPEPSISFDQAKIVATYARIDKDAQGWALVVRVSFGPLAKVELAYLEDWRLGQRWINWYPAEAGFFDDAATPQDAPEVDEPLQFGDDGRTH